MQIYRRGSAYPASILSRKVVADLSRIFSRQPPVGENLLSQQRSEISSKGQSSPANSAPLAGICHLYESFVSAIVSHSRSRNRLRAGSGCGSKVTIAGNRFSVERDTPVRFRSRPESSARPKLVGGKIFLGRLFSVRRPTRHSRRESSKRMKSANLLSATLLAAALACSPALVVGQTTASQDAHKAGQDTKNAAKDTGHAAKKGSEHAYHSTKNGSKKAWNKTKSGSKKGWNKTKGATKGAYKGAKNGADTSH